MVKTLLCAHFVAASIGIGTVSLFLSASMVSAQDAGAPPAVKEQRPARSRAVFERRILPLLRSSKPSTCAECHLSGVDLKNYLRPSEQETFISLRDQKLIDLTQPDRSHILRLIRMSRPKTPLLTQQARDAEYAAFRDWIRAVVADPKLRNAPRLSASRRAGPQVSNAVIQHTRLDHVLASFERNVWAQEGRCMNCHRTGSPENAAHVKKYGERVAWFVPDSPEATMQKILAQKLVNVQSPEQSLLLLKPLNKVPHGGGVKLLYGDTGYKMIRTWIEDYARSITGKYRTVQDLPHEDKEALVYTESILNVKETPIAWVDKLLRVDAYSWDQSRDAWSKTPIATGDRQVGGNRETNVLMFRVIPVRSAREQSQSSSTRLAPGRYLLKYYVDTKDRLAGDYTLPMNAISFYQGEQEITSEWKTGWGNLTQIRVSVR